MDKYPEYVVHPKEKKHFLETWADSVPDNNKKKFYITIFIILGLLLLVGGIVVMIFMSGKKETCKDAFCKVVKNAQEKINSKVIVK